jgi:arylsulfatase A-like enzyme/Flp pilus assembly protein TadD
MTTRVARTTATLYVAFALAAAWASTGCSENRPERVVLVTIDTLRADHLSCYGARTPQTPHLDALARSGVRFATAIAPTPLTLPSHTSLLTGLDPHHHGVRNNGTFALESAIPTIATRMREEGFATAAFLGAVVLDRQYGLARGFDVYDDAMSVRRHMGDTGLAERRADRVVDAALEWLALAPDRFLLWVHLYDPHADYDPPRRFKRAWAGAPYAGEVAFADSQLGRLLDAVDARWPDGRTLVVATSDHGESLGEHGEASHAYTLYDATQRIPLLIRGPGFPAGEVVETPVRLVDVAPTILARLSAAPLAKTDGTDLSSLVTGSDRAPRVAYLETLAPQLDLSWSPMLGLRTRDWKYVRAPRPELYDLRADPKELRNQASQNPARVEALDRELEAHLAGARTTERRVALDSEQRARLEALGYVSAPVEIGPGVLGVVGGLDPKDGLPDLERMGGAMGLLKSGRPEEALRALESVEGGGPMLALLRAEAAGELGDPVVAERHARTALEVSPDFAWTWVLLGRALEAGGKSEAAAEAYHRGAALDAAAAEPWVGLGRLAEDRGERERARDLYTRAAAKRGRSAEAVWRSAALLIEDGERVAAEAVLAPLPGSEVYCSAAALRLARAEAAAGRPEAGALRLARALRQTRNPRERAELIRERRALRQK